MNEFKYMKELIRTFIAVKIRPEEKLYTVLKEMQKELKNEVIKWVELENLHLTLKFLGDTSKKQIEEIKSILEQLSGQFTEIKADLRGIGYFKKYRNPTVLFSEIQNYEEIKKFASLLEFQLHSIGFDKEKREFKPHLTLGRINFLRDKNKFYTTIEKYRETQFQMIKISEIIFYQSILNQQGPEYRPLKTVRLN